MEGLITGSDRVGALWVEVKTLCGFKPCLVSVSVGSGNDTEDVFPVGLVAGVPWIGEWHGEVRGEIFGGIPAQGQEETCQLTEVADGCISSLCRNTLLEMHQSPKLKQITEYPSPLWAQPRAVITAQLPLLPAISTCWTSGSKHKAYFPCWAGCTNWTWSERQVCGTAAGINMFWWQTHTTPKRQLPVWEFLLWSFFSYSFSVTTCKAGLRKAYTHSQKISMFLKTSNKPKRAIFSTPQLSWSMEMPKSTCAALARCGSLGPLFYLCPTANVKCISQSSISTKCCLLLEPTWQFLLSDKVRLKEQRSKLNLI